jgi:bacteriochlorophyll 4-vinyl reductase
MSRTSSRRAIGPTTPSVTPVFPLLLLETMRDMDRPEEVLEGEDLTASMPRRLGLSDVVYLQIHKFREETKKKSLQSSATVEDLMRLVIRRPDCDEIFEEAGRRMAKRAWDERSNASRRAVRLLPAGMRMRSAARATRRLMGQLAGLGSLDVQARPFQVRLRDSLTSRADPGGAACAFYTGVVAELITRYMGRKHNAVHSRCSARGADTCEWNVLVVS